jgi:hypothetical protein
MQPEAGSHERRNRAENSAESGSHESRIAVPGNQKNA